MSLHNAYNTGTMKPTVSAGVAVFRQLLDRAHCASPVSYREGEPFHRPNCWGDVAMRVAAVLLLVLATARGANIRAYCNGGFKGLDTGIMCAQAASVSLRGCSVSQSFGVAMLVCVCM